MLPAILSTIISIAGTVGAPVVKGILEKKIGKAGADIAEAVVKEIATRAGTVPEEIPNMNEDDLGTAIREVENNLPEILIQYNEQQRQANELQLAEMEKGPLWTWAWRPLAMYLILFMAFAGLICFPIASLFYTGLTFDFATFMTFSSFFISLYMGGHTLKDVVKTWSETRKNQ